jgi:tetratricopeptide (TPR) repeat protein
LKGALEDVSKSIALNPKNAEAYCNLAIVNLSLRHTANARSNFDKCYAIDATLKPKFEALASELDPGDGFITLNPKEAEK